MRVNVLPISRARQERFVSIRVIDPHNFLFIETKLFDTIRCGYKTTEEVTAFTFFDATIVPQLLLSTLYKPMHERCKANPSMVYIVQSTTRSFE
jgi:hypothetical protein